MAEESGFRNKLIRAFGLDDIDDEEYDEEELDETYYPEVEAIQTQTTIESQTITTPPPSPAKQEEAPDVLVLEPTSFDEAPGIVNKLKQDKTIVVNLKQIDFEEGKKIFDFLSGAVYALEGSLNRIAESVFILAPKIIKVATNMNENKSRSTNMPSYENN